MIWNLSTSFFKKKFNKWAIIKTWISLFLSAVDTAYSLTSNFCLKTSQRKYRGMNSKWFQKIYYCDLLKQHEVLKTTIINQESMRYYALRIWLLLVKLLIFSRKDKKMSKLSRRSMEKHGKFIAARRIPINFPLFLRKMQRFAVKEIAKLSKFITASFWKQWLSFWKSASNLDCVKNAVYEFLVSSNLLFFLKNLVF